MKEKKRMNICFVTPFITEKGGLARYARELIPRIRNKVYLNVISRRERGRWFRTTAWVLKNSVYFSFNTNDYIIHANAFRAGLIPHLARKPYLLHCHDVGPQRLYRFRAWLQKIVVKNAAKIICPTEAIKKAIIKGEMANRSKIKVIYNGVDTEKFKPLQIRKPKIPTILFPSRRAHYKGLEVLESAIQILKDKGVKCKLIAPKEWLTDSELIRLYNTASVAVVPSLLGEGFSFAATEALACGCKVVASDLPAIRETAGKYALYVEPGDAADLANKIEIALGKEWDSWEAHEYIKNRFSWNIHIQELLEVYYEMWRFH